MPSASSQNPGILTRRVPNLSSLEDGTVNSLTTGRGLFSSRPYLQFMEDMRGGTNVHYEVAYDSTDEDRIVAFIPVYDGGASPNSYWHPNRHYLARAVEEEPQALWDPCRFIGIRSGYGWSPLLDTELSVDRCSEAIRALMGAVRGKPLAAMFMSTAGRDILCHSGLSHSDFFVAGATSELSVGGRSFDDYVADLPRPPKARREMQRFAQSGASAEVLSLREAADLIAPHLVSLATKYGLTSSVDAELVELHGLNRRFGDAARALVLRRGGATIGGAVFIEWEGELYVRQAGFDYDQTGKSFEYFNVYYSIVRHAIECGAEKVDFGMSAYRAKLVRGASIKPLWGYAEDRSGRRLTERPQFRRWDARRRECLTNGSIEEIERADLP